MNRAGMTAGIDEAGRGPLAGPVVAAAVILPPSHGIEGIADSKTLSPGKRKEIYTRLVEDDRVKIGVGVGDADVIDRLNIRNATLLSMRKALDDIGTRPANVLVDGPDIGSFQVPHTPVIGGDSLCEVIGAASIVAKVTRDEIMLLYDRIFPAYGFRRNKGYGTPDHIARLRAFGPCRVHRRSFEPLKGMLSEENVG
ncbi:MAG: ribonuclease HII [Candidatus Tritonobacter lacicola]|nr:ribonuclease HII [Candidatus Tritonobacter lacicola]